MSDMAVDYDGLIPNNVGLNADPRLRRALEQWHPTYLDWWKDRGPDGFQDNLVYLRTAIGVDQEGWAKFGYVRMPDYRWGILLAPQVERDVEQRAGRCDHDLVGWDNLLWRGQQRWHSLHDHFNGQADQPSQLQRHGRCPP